MAQWYVNNTIDVQAVSNCINDNLVQVLRTMKHLIDQLAGIDDFD